SATADPETYQDQYKGKDVTVFVSALPPSTLSGAGRVCRRVKHENPSAKVLVGVWSSEAKMEALKRRLDPAGVDGIVTRLGDAIAQVKNLLTAPTESNVPVAETESTRAAERMEVRLAANRPEEATDTVTRELARAFDIPIALVSLIETDREFWQHSPVGSNTSTPFIEAAPHEAALATDTLLIVEDVAKDDRFSGNPVFLKRGVRFIASAPLRLRSGHLVGNLCILDTQPRPFLDKDRELLESLASQLMEAVEPDVTPAVDPALT
ncbi:MAG: GAF domain-containing protein, partial [Opitutus sp.]